MEPKTILVVEDDFDILEIICALLNEEGHMPVRAGNGKIALDYLDEMKTAGFNIPIVVLSAVTESAKGLGVKAYVSKPFEFSSLLRTILAHSA